MTLLHPIILIPARMASTRLPGKPLADIGGMPMIVQVMRRAEEAAQGPVVVAAAEQEIVAAVERAGGRAVRTDPGHPSGSDRIWEALQKIDPKGAYDVVVNVQGDLPTLGPALIKAAVAVLENPEVDIATLVCEIKDPQERTNPNVVKVVMGAALSSPPARGSQVSAAAEHVASDPRTPAGVTIGRALYFTRATAPYGEGPLYHHIGLYAYRRAALERFVALPPSMLEKREKLEQLRALEHGMRIDVAVVDTVPLGVDTPEDLEKARVILGGGKRAD